MFNGKFHLSAGRSDLIKTIKFKQMKALLIILLFVSTTLVAQQRFITKTGSVNFEASVPSFEEVAAKNNSATAILDIQNGEFATLILVKGFRFKNALMEEHFNENYAESSKFPKASFKGKIDDFDIAQLSEAKNNFKINGELTFHGITKNVSNIVLTIIKKTETTISLTGNFKVSPSDYNIDIPSIVKNKISNDVVVTFSFELQKQ